MYEALSGRRPFRGATPLALMRAIERGDAESLAVLRPDVPAALVAFVARSMSVDPEGRFASAREMAGALASAPDLDETVAVNPPPHDGTTQTLAPPVAVVAAAAAPDHARRRRSRAIVVGTGIVLAALVIAGFISRRDPAHPAAPPRVVATTTSTTPTTAAPTTTVTVATPVTAPGPPGHDKGGPGKANKGKPKP